MPAVARYRKEPTPIAANWRQAYSLPADASSDIGPYQVFRRGQKVLTGLTEIRPVRGLIEPQACQIGRGPCLEPGGAKRVSPMVVSVLMQNWTMPGELQRRFNFRLPFYRDHFAHHPHGLPGVPVAVTERVGGISHIDVQVFLVNGENREAPRPV